MQSAEVWKTAWCSGLLMVHDHKNTAQVRKVGRASFYSSGLEWGRR